MIPVRSLARTLANTIKTATKLDDWIINEQVTGGEPLLRATVSLLDASCPRPKWRDVEYTGIALCDAGGETTQVDLVEADRRQSLGTLPSNYDAGELEEHVGNMLLAHDLGLAPGDHSLGDLRAAVVGPRAERFAPVIDASPTAPPRDTILWSSAWVASYGAVRSSCRARYEKDWEQFVQMADALLGPGLLARQSSPTKEGDVLSSPSLTTFLSRFSSSDIELIDDRGRLQVSSASEHDLSYELRRYDGPATDLSLAWSRAERPRLLSALNGLGIVATTATHDLADPTLQACPDRLTACEIGR